MAEHGCAIVKASTDLPASVPLRPFLPLAVGLPRMLEKIEAELATARPADAWRLRQQAELIRELLTLRRGHLACRD